MNGLDLSIIIVSWRVKNLLSQCLRSIAAETKNLQYEIIVVDNNSRDGTAKLVAADFPEVKLIINTVNAGFAAANNQGIKAASGRYLLLLNPDTLIINGALDKMAEYLDTHRDMAMAGCKILNSDGSTQNSIRRFPRFSDNLAMMFKLHHLFNLKRYLCLDFDYAREAEVEQIMGAFMFLRKAVVERIGLFDEKFKVWFEEVDFCRRAASAGLKIYYTPAAQIIHYGGQSFNQVNSLLNQWRFSASRLHYCHKHLFWPAYLVICLFTPISLGLSWLGGFIPHHPTGIR